MGLTLEDIAEEELCYLMCGAPEDDYEGMDEEDE